MLSAASACYPCPYDDVSMMVCGVDANHLTMQFGSVCEMSFFNCLSGNNFHYLSTGFCPMNDLAFRTVAASASRKLSDAPPVAIVSTCDGTVISSSYILTAAHCVTGYDSAVSFIDVTLGEYDRSKDLDCTTVNGHTSCSTTSIIRAQQIIPHQQYEQHSKQNDIALLRLVSALDFNSASIQPICLPVGATDQLRTLEGETVTVTGWGYLGPGNAVTANVLQTVQLPIVVNARCNAALQGHLNDFTGVTAGQMCASGDHKDSCHGDSGGPLMHRGLSADGKMVQYGIVSYGAECGTTRFPAVYTRVGFHMNWILSNMYG